MTMPNRLQEHWAQMKPRILAHWDQLTEGDLESTGGKFDQLIDLIRRRYKPGRSIITVEANIYDWLLHEICNLEGTDLDENTF